MVLTDGVKPARSEDNEISRALADKHCRGLGPDTWKNWIGEEFRELENHGAFDFRRGDEIEKHEIKSDQSKNRRNRVVANLAKCVSTPQRGFNGACFPYPRVSRDCLLIRTL
mgnify:CR=1 FL=1